MRGILKGTEEEIRKGEGDREGMGGRNRWDRMGI